MNERIRELGRQAGLYMENTMAGGFPNESIIAAEQFALLIIEECAIIAEQASEYRLPASSYGDLIRKFEPLKEQDYTVGIG